MIRFALIALTGLMILGACAPVSQIKKQIYLDEPSSTMGDDQVYVVKRGDTLYKIARSFRVKVADLKRLNGITDVRDIPVGMRLRIPSGGVSTPSDKASTTAQDAPVSSSVRFAWPVKKIDISSPYGIRGNHKHDGLDLRNPRGTPIYASADGEVIFSGWGPAGYGNLVIVKHDAVFISVYAHNQRNDVRKGASVKKGQQVGIVGATGRATGTHVHFEIRKNRKPVDPLQYLPKL